MSAILKGLRGSGFKSMAVAEVEGTGRFTRPEVKPSLKFPITHSKMAKLELVCKREDVEAIVRLIHQHGGTGEKGDGIIYVSEVKQVFKVRTGEDSQDE